MHIVSYGGSLVGGPKKKGLRNIWNIDSCDDLLKGERKVQFTSEAVFLFTGDGGSVCQDTGRKRLRLSEGDEKLRWVTVEHEEKASS